MLKTLKTVSLCAAVLLGGWGNVPKAHAAESPSGPTPFLLDEDTRKAIYYQGNSEAPFIFIQFQSQTCSWAQDFHENVFPHLKEKYIDTGKVFFISVPYVQHDMDMQASMVAQCANDENYWPLVEALYRQRDAWAQLREKGKVVRSMNLDRVREIATEYGVDLVASNTCLNDENLRKRLLDARFGANAEFGIFRSPQYVVNGRVYNELSVEDLDWLFSQPQG